MGRGQAPWPPERLFSISIVNPSGLNGKAGHMASLPTALFAISETQLSRHGISQFRRGLAFANRGLRWLPGAPAPVRSTSRVTGDFTGVGFLSPVPQRALPCTWPQEVWETARIQAACFYIEPTWVQGAVIYGFASQKEGTPRLLQAAVDRIVHGATGPRFLAGDWNLMADEVPQWAELAHAGFKEVQDLASAWWGQAAQFTCKGSSRKDFLMVSAELACLLQAVEVRHDVFPDYAQVTANFAVGDLQIPRLIWRQPWPPNGQRSTDQLPALSSSDVDRRMPVNERYTSIFRSFEDRLSAARVEAGGQPLTAAQRGRATTLDVRPSLAKHLPPTKGREGEFVPHLPAPSALHIQWYKQLRRLQALEQGLRRQSAALGNPQQRAELWRAIRHAPGFVPDFPTWAASTLPCCKEIPCFPPDPPPHAFAAACFEAFRNCVRSLEQQVSRQAAQTAKAARAKNPALIFRDLAQLRHWSSANKLRSWKCVRRRISWSWIDPCSGGTGRP